MSKDTRVSRTIWTPSEIWDNLPNIIELSNTDGVITMARNKLVDMIGKLSEEQVERSVFHPEVDIICLPVAKVNAAKPVRKLSTQEIRAF